MVWHAQLLTAVPRLKRNRRCVSGRKSGKLSFSSFAILLTEPFGGTPSTSVCQRFQMQLKQSADCTSVCMTSQQCRVTTSTPWTSVESAKTEPSNTWIAWPLDPNPGPPSSSRTHPAACLSACLSASASSSPMNASNTNDTSTLRPARTTYASV